MKNEEILDTIQKIAEEIGFDLVGVADIEEIASSLAMTNKNEKLDEWVKNGYCGEMKWFADTAEKRKDILKVMPDAKSVICVAMNYYCNTESKKDAKSAISHSYAIAYECEIRNSGGFDEAIGKIARYARGRDYHKIFNRKLKLFAKGLEKEILHCSQDDKQNDKNWIPAGVYPPAGGRGMTKERVGMTNAKFKYYCDTGPVLERIWAVKAGLGFVGKNTNLITKYGSWVLLGEIITNIEIKNPKHEIRNPKQIQNNKSQNLKHFNDSNLKFSNCLEFRYSNFEFTGTCGSCRRCLDACPTGALVASYTVDARKCISYLTIEHKGEIPMELREKMGNRIFGCDACQEVCPFNIGRSAAAKALADKSKSELTQSIIARQEIDLKEILSIKTDEEFLEKFAGSPVMRAKRWGLVRNACVAAGNSGDKSLLPYLEECLKDKEPIIVSHAKWAIEKIEKMIR